MKDLHLLLSVARAICTIIAHMEEEEKKVMRAREEEILNKFEIRR